MADEMNIKESPIKEPSKPKSKNNDTNQNEVLNKSFSPNHEGFWILKENFKDPMSPERKLNVTLQNEEKTDLNNNTCSKNKKITTNSKLYQHIASSITSKFFFQKQSQYTLMTFKEIELQINETFAGL